jgi:RNA polymerase sigma factor (sigma-70 family)
MAAGQANRVVHHLRWIAQGCAERTQTDGKLLECFIGRQDESAFEELVRRHGPMVLGVCRRLLNNAHDADDAFQATFMVLVRKARSIVPRELVGHWLYGVACRVALHAQAQASRRRAREKQVEDMPHPTAPVVAPNDLRPVLDLELSRLPEKYRVPIVLCDLEGRSRKEVARQVGVPEGTLSSRLATARKMLADRLARRGLVAGSGVLAGLFLDGAAPAAVPGTLAISTVKAAAAGAASQAVALGLLSAQAAALTEGVMKAMLISKLKAMMAVILTLGLLTTGAGAMKLGAGEPGPGQEAAQPARPKPLIVVETGDAPKTAPPAGEKNDGIFFLQRFQDAGEIVKPGKKPAVKDPLDYNLIHSHAFRDIIKCDSCHKAPNAILSRQPGNRSHDEEVAKLWDWIGARRSDDIIVIRVPRKDGAPNDSELLRRLCLDLAGRTPTRLEMYYFLKDTDPNKYQKVVEKVVEQPNKTPQSVLGSLNKGIAAPAKPADPATRAEEYVKEKLGKKQLSGDERKLLEKVLEFVEKERAQTTRSRDELGHWLESAPKAIVPKEQGK